MKTLHGSFKLFVFCSMPCFVNSQTVYTTSFNAGHGWTLNTFTNLNTGIEGDSPNIWYVSDKESNKGVGNRGGANCGNVTLHVGSTTIGDGGAAYDAGGCTNLGFGPCASCVTNGLYCVKTDRSAISPAINTTGQTGLTLSFLYIHWGTALLDNGEIIYSVDGGITWATLGVVPKSGCCSGTASCAAGCTNNATCTGSHQGKWTLYSSMLPVSCENISNLMLGFRWYNDDVSTSAKDPSIAVDDVTITTSVLPVEASLLQSYINPDNIGLKWLTFSEHHNKGFIIERSEDGLNFEPIGFVTGKNSTAEQSYSFNDFNAKQGSVYYYRYQQEDDHTKKSLYSNIVSGELIDEDHFKIYPNPANDNITVTFDQTEHPVSIELSDLYGKTIRTYTMHDLKYTTPGYLIDAKDFSNGIYFYKVSGLNKPVTGKLIIQH
ncbi:MAG: T9SS type A sorting domain-containing protein [Bacteroidota bacterium]